MGYLQLHDEWYILSAPAKWDYILESDLGMNSQPLDYYWKKWKILSDFCAAAKINLFLF